MCISGIVVVLGGADGAEDGAPNPCADGADSSADLCVDGADSSADPNVDGANGRADDSADGTDACIESDGADARADGAPRCTDGTDAPSASVSNTAVTTRIEMSLKLTRSRCMHGRHCCCVM